MQGWIQEPGTPGVLKGMWRVEPRAPASNGTAMRSEGRGLDIKVQAQPEPPRDDDARAAVYM